VIIVVWNFSREVVLSSEPKLTAVNAELQTSNVPAGGSVLFDTEDDGARRGVLQFLE